MSQGVAEFDTSSEPVRTDAWRRWQISRTLLPLLVALLLVALWLVVQTVVFARTYERRILPGAEISGVDVSGMSTQEALAAVHAVVDPQLGRTIKLVYLGQAWETTPRQLGAASDADAAVAEAMAASDAVDWGDVFRMRWMGDGLGIHRSVTVTHDEQGARALVHQIAAQIDAPARNATIDYSSGWIEFFREQPGRTVATEQTTAGLLAALAGAGDVVAVQASETQPSVTTAAFAKVLLLRQHEHRLYLYENGVVTHSWLVATGTGGYPTPTGRYTIAEKRYMPTWVNPAPQGWGKDLPASIPPGVANPLGVRALNWSGVSGIRFHGTSDIGSLGNSASHGCVRLSNSDIVELYDLVSKGTTIISVR